MRYLAKKIIKFYWLALAASVPVIILIYILSRHFNPPFMKKDNGDIIIDGIRYKIHEEDFDRPIKVGYVMGERKLIIELRQLQREGIEGIYLGWQRRRYD